MKEPINKITLKDGSVRYRLVVDIGRDEHGRRKQLTRTFDTRREAREELSRIRHETNLGTYVKPSKETVNSYLDELPRRAQLAGCAPPPSGNYEDALRPVRERLGDTSAPVRHQSRRRGSGGLDAHSRPQAGGEAGNGPVRSDGAADAGRFSAALEAAVLEGKLVRNVAKLVKPPEHTPRERETWSKAEVRKFLAKASSDRLYAAWRLSLYGLRRGEVLGLRWSDIDLRARTLTVNQARVLVEYRVRIEEPKSRNGKRTLPLDGELVAALTALRKRQLEESTIAGAAYGRTR